MKFKLPLKAHTAPALAAAVAVFIAGVSVGVAGNQAFNQRKVLELQRSNGALLSFSAGQSQALASLNLEVASAVHQPEHAQEHAPKPTANNTPIESQAAPVAAAPAAPSRQAAPAKAVQTVTPVASKGQSVATPPARPTEPQVTPPMAQAQPPAPSTQPAPAPAPAPAPTAVTMDQAGIAGIDTAGVRFKSGRQINIGSEFPSGEKLISVNPGEGKIVTDRRVITVVKPPIVQ